MNLGERLFNRASSAESTVSDEEAIDDKDTLWDDEEDEPETTKTYEKSLSSISSINK